METNPTSIREDVGLILSPAQWMAESGVAVSCGVGHRPGSDPALLWLRRRPVATALIRSLAWEPPYAMGAALKIQKPKAKSQKKKKKRKKERKKCVLFRPVVFLL